MTDTTHGSEGLQAWYTAELDERDRREGYVYSTIWLDPKVPQAVCEAHEALAKARTRALDSAARFDVLEGNVLEQLRRWACGEIKDGEGRS